MDFNSQMEMKGRLTISINNEVVRDIDNLVVTTGKGYVASRMKDATATAMSHMAVGTTFPAGTGTAALTEAAVLNASSGGTMLCRTVFLTVNKGANDSMSVSWSVTAS